ncbi:hypothetical protein F5B17DRAFT_383126 [Nemania serpens]|nr:hypothetical protein F5B17DRAFT_383126 [Nemania serpens]
MTTYLVLRSLALSAFGAICLEQKREPTLRQLIAELLACSVVGGKVCRYDTIQDCAWGKYARANPKEAQDGVNRRRYLAAEE